jgi:hypothetical protein
MKYLTNVIILFVILLFFKRTVLISIGVRDSIFFLQSSTKKNHGKGVYHQLCGKGVYHIQNQL